MTTSNVETVTASISTEEIALPTAVEIVSKYIEYRNFIDAETKKFKAAMKPYNDAMEMLESAAALLIKRTGQKALSTEAGTAFFKTVVSVKNEDPDAFMTFVLEGGYAREALTAHVKKEFVELWMENHEGAWPPGISTTKLQKVEFRKS